MQSWSSHIRVRGEEIERTGFLECKELEFLVLDPETFPEHKAAYIRRKQDEIMKKYLSKWPSNNVFLSFVCFLFSVTFFRIIFYVSYGFYISYCNFILMN